MIGDVPRYGLASRSPAILERVACPICGGQFQMRGRVLEVVVTNCPQCSLGQYYGQEDIRFSVNEFSMKPGHILLPNGAIGAEVSMAGDDLRWLDEWEMR